MSEGMREQVGSLLRKLADELKVRDHDRHKKQNEETDRRAAMARERALRRNIERIRLDWDMAGEKPLMAGDLVISRSLAKNIEDRLAADRREAPEAQKKAPASRQGPEIPF